MIFCTSLKKCECKNSGLCNKPCKRPLCKPLCPCIKKTEEVKEELNTLKGDVERNTQKIENNYNQLNDAISDLAEIHAKDHRDVLKYIDDKDAENDSLLLQEIEQRITDVDAEEDRAIDEELRIDLKLDLEIQDRIDDVNAEEDRAKAAEQYIDDKIDQEISDRIRDIDDLNDRLDDALGIDAEGLAELKAILSDNDTATGIIVELAKKAEKSGVNAGTYRSVTVNSDGVVTAGTNPTTLAGYLISDANITDGQSGGKVITLGNNDVTVYTKSESDTLLGDKADKVSATPGTYKSVTVNDQGIVTAGTNPTTIDGYGITDAYTKSEIDTSLSGKADVATTIAGYGITDAKIENGANDIGKKITLGNQNVTVYTKSEVDALISDLLNLISTLLGYWSVNNDNRLETSYVIEPYGYK